MYRIVVIDDEAIWRETVIEQIEQALAELKIDDYSIVSYASGIPLLTGLKLGDCYDLVFTDVRIGKKESGIELTREIRQLSPDTRIILFSSNRDFVFDGYDVRAVYFFSKPVDEMQLKAILARDYFGHYMRQTIRITLDSGPQTLLLQKDIHYFDHAYGLTRITLEDEVIETRERLADLMDQLPSLEFIQPHKSYIVNLRYVQALERYQFTLTDGTQIPISKQRFLQSRDAYEKYLVAQLVAPQNI